MIVVRQGPTGLEVFCVLRHARSGFLGGAVVFPGGKVDAADAADAWLDLASAPDPRAEAFVAPFGGAPATTARALAVAACRESLEEARIVPLDAPVTEADVEALHVAIAGGRGGASAFAAALGRAGRRLALDALLPFARWVTPTAEERRFDARFFLLEAPEGQRGRHDDHETTASFWDSPAVILDRATRGEVFLAPPTTRCLELLAEVDTVAGARALGAEQSLLPVCPELVPEPVTFLALPGDPAHSLRELRVAGPTRFVLREGRFVSEHAPG